VAEARAAFCAAFGGGRLRGGGSSGGGDNAGDSGVNDDGAGGDDDDQVQELARAFCDHLGRSASDSGAACVLDLGRECGATDSHLAASRQSVRALIDAYATQQHCSSSFSSLSLSLSLSRRHSARECVAEASRFAAELSARRRATECASGVHDGSGSDDGEDELATVAQFLARAGLLDHECDDDGTRERVASTTSSSASHSSADDADTDLVSRFASAGVVEIDQLLALGGNKAPGASGAYADCLAALSREPFRLAHARAATLAELLTRTPTLRGALARFERTSSVPRLRAEIAAALVRVRVRARARDAMLPVGAGRPGALSRGVQDKDKDKESTARSIANDGDAIIAACAEAAAATEAAAHQIALGCRDWSGRSRVSMLQLSALLRRHGLAHDVAASVDAICQTLRAM
jgi:hypothetical protein